ncbi:MAG: AAA family ATPase [Clostridiales bacterium]|nr:AAA family ATPase [Clostridiales bacterium]
MNEENYKPLEEHSLQELAEKEFVQRDPLIEHMLPPEGTLLFCGSSKIGKSWLALDMGLHICKGEKFWGYDVRKAAVLYICLEDGELRLQNRMFKIGEEGQKDFYYATDIASTEEDIIKQLDEQMEKHPEIGLIIIDSLTALRAKLAVVNNNAFIDDYRILNAFHHFTDNHHITLLIVHHVRKMRSEDPFDDIAGTNGLSAAADGSFVFRKEKFTDDEVKLYAKCRDAGQHMWTIRLDEETCIWKMIHESTPMEDVINSDPDLKKTVEFIRKERSFFGSATEFCERIGVEKKPQSLSGKLFNHRRELAKQGIDFERTRGNKGSIFCFSLISDEVTNMSPPPLIEDILQPQEFVTNSDDVTTFSPTEGTAEESLLAYEEDNIVTSSQEPP